MNLLTIIDTNIEETTQDLEIRNAHHCQQWVHHVLNNQGGLLEEMKAGVWSKSSRIRGVYTDKIKVLYILRENKKTGQRWLIQASESLETIRYTYGSNKDRQEIDLLRSYRKKDKIFDEHCGKVSYIDIEQANKRLREIARTSTKKVVPKRAYRCRKCGLIHLTSKTLILSEAHQ